MCRAYPPLGSGATARYRQGMKTRIALPLSMLCLLFCAGASGGETTYPPIVRIMTFNIEDLRPEQITQQDDRVLEAVDLIRATGASVVLINEMARTENGRHAALFAQMLGDGTDWTWTYYAPPSNTGEHSGMDLDNNGTQSPDDDGRAYGGDSFGYGEFPGQYAMCLFVRSDAEVFWDDIRTFRTFKWKDMPGAMLPPADGEGTGSWFSDEELGAVRLSSKSHWDVPVRLADGRVVHLLCAHPSPPGFDGPEDRNGRRNHDEIRFWLEYIDGAEWIVDDAGGSGGLDPGASFIVMGDLNADPIDGDGRENPAKKLLDHPRVNAGFAPTSEIPGTSRGRGAWEETDTAAWGLRVDYVQPSIDLPVRGGGVIRGSADIPGREPQNQAYGVSDHFPVWVELELGTDR